MALVSGFAGRFADTAAVSSIVHILQQAINSTDEELRAEMVPTTLRALANIAKVCFSRFYTVALLAIA